MMIDINKYKGHDDWEDTKVNMANEANKQLIADAPLLLAEVKRLKIYERLVLCIAYHQQLPDGLYVDEELMLRAREHLRKNGEWEDEEE